MSDVKELDIHGWEKVYVKELYGGYLAIIAIHNTNRGPALGGCRFFHYDNHPAKQMLALEDALRLSRGMTYKAAAANLPLGGGKSVIIRDFYEPIPGVRRNLFHSFGDFVESLGGKYITAEDVGTTTDDMVYVYERTSHVVGLPEDQGGLGDPSPVTAIGIAEAIRWFTENYLKRDPSDISVLIQGLGKVGWYLMEFLNERGYKLLYTDVSQKKIDMAREKYPHAEYVQPDDVFDVEVDIFSPNALGKVINHETVDKIKAKVVAGAANNQVENRHVAQRLHERGIIYAPDYTINLGGLTLVYYEYELRQGKIDSKEEAKSTAIEKTKENVWKNLDEIIPLSLEKNISPYILADEIMEKRWK